MRALIFILLAFVAQPAFAQSTPDDDQAENVRICREHRHVDPDQVTQPHHPPWVWDTGWEKQCEKIERAFLNDQAAKLAKNKAAAEPDRLRLIDAAKKLPN